MLATEALITLRLQLLPLTGIPGAGVLRARRRGVGFFFRCHAMMTNWRLQMPASPACRI